MAEMILTENKYLSVFVIILFYYNVMEFLKL